MSPRRESKKLEKSAQRSRKGIIVNTKNFSLIDSTHILYIFESEEIVHFAYVSLNTTRILV